MPPKNSPEWFEVAFNADYASIYADADDRAPAEVERILGFLSLPQTAPFPTPRILDLACGWGRHALLLALAGYDVTGVDYSQFMLEQAYEQALKLDIRAEIAETIAVPTAEASRRGRSVPSRRGKLTLLRADMRDLPFQDEFHYAINIFTSFGYFPNGHENARVLKEVHKALVVGGRFVLDLDNADAFPTRVPLHQDMTVSIENDTRHEEPVHKDETIDRTGRRRVVEYRFTDHPDKPPIHLECELYTSDHIKKMLQSAGFEIVALRGDLMGNAFSRTSPRLVVVASKMPPE